MRGRPKSKSLTKDELLKREHCNKCIFSMRDSGDGQSPSNKHKGFICGYILIMGHSRGCPAGLTCDKYSTDKSILKKRRPQFVI